MIATLLTFSLAAMLLTLTPGLDTALILRTSIAEGRKNGFKAALGINAGCFIWGAIVALGLGALLAASQVAYDCLKWIGAPYLLGPIASDVDILVGLHPCCHGNIVVDGVDQYRRKGIGLFTAA